MEHMRVSLLTCTLLSLLAWNGSVECITVHSRRGETHPVVLSTPSPISNQNFTLAVRLLERMLLTVSQRRLIIPYYGYYFVNNQISYTPFIPVHPLDLLSRSIFSSPIQQEAYSSQFHRNQIRPTAIHAAIIPDLLLASRPKIVHNYHPTKQVDPDYHPIPNKYLVPRPKPIDLFPPPSLPPKLLASAVTRFSSEPPNAKKAGMRIKDAGTPGLDYPTFHKIPPTSFSCATQRYKGFFADPETSCQVWHYCDLNGGQASFLCPNGTIFSQVLLTCDWWFNVKCTNTLKAYVLNERLYKFVMPKKPSFPEDYSGLQVNDYLIQKLPEYHEKEVAKAERLKKKYKAFEFDDVDELQALNEKMRKSPSDDNVLQKNEQDQ